jgi:uncharacterized protein (DUF488 family)
MPVFTIGHSTLQAEEFARQARKHGIALVIDIRSVPGSRRNPQYLRSALEVWLPEHGIGYRWLPALGGWRKPRPDSPNSYWRNDSFRGFADYMATPAFAEALAGAEQLAQTETICLMCSEALPWRCHRWLVADALVLHGCSVTHIVGGTARPHQPTPCAHIESGVIVYPATPDEPSG